MKRCHEEFTNFLFQLGSFMTNTRGAARSEGRTKALPADFKKVLDNFGFSWSKTFHASNIIEQRPAIAMSDNGIC